MIDIKAVCFLALAVISTQAGALAGAVSSSTDEIFVTHAVQAGLAEVADGNLAASVGASKTVRSIGSRMVVDHTKANSKLTSIARADSLAVPTAPTAADRSSLSKQKQLVGSAFDELYLNDQRTAHQNAIALFQTEIAQGSNPQLVGFAKQTLPALQMHLKLIEAAIDAG